MPELNKIYPGDSLFIMKTWPDGFVQCVITSPPYYGLRDYGIDEQIGLESTPSEYIFKMTGIFDEVKRVLRGDGTLWLNIGDSYASNCKVGNKYEKRKKDDISQAHCLKAGGAGIEYYKPKDLMLIPFRLAIEMQKRGWYLRSVIPWIKRNPMPESARDRPATKIEYVFLFSKSASYFFDMEATKKPYIDKFLKQHQTDMNGRTWRSSDPFFDSFQGLYSEDDNPLAFIVNSKAMNEAHFAAFPQLLVKDCILAGTSEKGCCRACGGFLWRKLEPSSEYEKILGKSWHNHAEDLKMGMSQKKNLFKFYGEKYITKAWKKECQCSTTDTVPCLVFDPFMGSGTTALVAKKLFRNFLGIEINPKYISIAEKRLQEVSLI